MRSVRCPFQLRDGQPTGGLPKLSRPDSLSTVGVVLCLCLLMCQNSQAEDWTRWRGPAGTGVSRETDIATRWPQAGPDMSWQVTGIGAGYSSVVTRDGLLVTTGRVDGGVFCFALDAETGKQRWKTQVGRTSRNVMSTPTVHDGRVYAVDPDGELVCLRASDGKILWQRSYVEEFGGRLMSGRGYGESPLIDGDRLLVTPGGAEAMVVALDRKTGQTVWESPFPKMGGSGRDGAAFASLNITHAAGVRQIVQLTGRGLVGIDAQNGKFLWSYDDISNTTANIPTPIVSGDLVFSANGYHAGCVLLRLEQDSGRTAVKATEVYRLRGSRFQNHHGGCVLIDGHVYGGHGSNNGLPTCLDFRTGTIRWKRRGPGTGSASVVAAGGYMVFRYQDGVVALVEATPDEFRLTGTFQTPSSGGDSWSHPVISNGRLFLRENDTLWAYDVRRSGATSSESPAVALSPAGGTLQRLTVDDETTWPGRLYQFAFPAVKQKSLSLATLNNALLTVDGKLTPEAFMRLQQHRRPLMVSVSGTRIRTAGLQQLARLKSLVGLDVSVCRDLTKESFEVLATCSSLVFLAAVNTNITDTGLAHVARLPRLTALDLEGCDGVSDSSCTTLASIPTLRGLSLMKTAFEKQRVSNAGLEKLTALSKLERLTLAGNAVNNDGLRLLSRFPDLRELDLSILAVNDEGLAHLPEVKKLEWLNVRYSEGFGGVMMTNAGIRSLSQVTGLKTLNLTGAGKITDDCVEDLMQLSGLRSLKLSAAGITARGIARLRTGLPQCEFRSSTVNPAD